MRRPAVTLITTSVLLFLTGCATHPDRPTSGGVHVSGQLKGAGGGAPLETHVLLYRWEDGDSKPLLTLPAMADGHFSLAAPGPGEYLLRLTALGYPRRDLYIQLPEQAPELSLRATLPPYEPLEKVQRLYVRGSWSDPSKGELEQMTQQPDGTWVLDRGVTSDSVTYQLVGLTQPPRLVPNPQQEDFELTNEGNYLSRIRAKEGRVHIVFDPRKPLSRSTGTFQSTFASPYESLNLINGLHARVESAKDLVPAAQKQHSEDHDWEFDYGTLPEELMAVLRDTHQPSGVRQLAALDVLGLRTYHFSKHSPGERGEELAARILQLLPPTTPLWARTSNAVERLGSLVKKSEQAQVMMQFADHNPDANVQVTALISLLLEAQHTQDAQRSASLVERLRPYAQTNPLAANVIAEDPGKALVGRLVPAFSAPLLEGKGEVSNQSLLGRFYIIDFWATWCEPCKEQIPFLQKAVEKFKGRGDFTLLSLSFDESVEQIQQFRAQKWAMPWLHSLVGMDFNSPVAKAFHIQGIPQIVLVDAKGQVVAVGDGLKGEQLDKTLDALLPAPAH